MAAARAFLFDLDGTLIDSMPHHHAAWHEWYTRRGWAMEPGGFFASTAGRTNAEILADMFPQLSEDERVAMADEKEAIYRSIAARSLGMIAGATPFMEQAKASGIRMAVCTASTPQNMALAFSMHGIAAWMEAVVSPADGLRGKPHPDLFLEAARRLGIAPANCIVFEDAPLGVEAARRAGMAAVALTTTLPAEEFAAYPNVIAVHPDFATLAPLDLDGLTKEEHHA